MLVSVPSLTFLQAKSSDDKSSTITIDGNTSDFDQENDQIILAPGLLGKHYESEYDSQWGSKNEVITLKVTWDMKYLYLAANGVLDDGNYMLIYIDIGNGLGVNDVSMLSFHNRLIKFQNIKPNYFLIAQDNSTIPYFYKIISENSSSIAPLPSGDLVLYSSLINSAYGVLEARISWWDLFNLGAQKVAPGANLKLLACITGADSSTTVDTAPNTTKDLPVVWDTTAYVNNCLLLEIDTDFDGDPDMDADIYSRSTILVDFAGDNKQAVRINNVEIKNRAFSPNGDGINDCLEISYELSKDANVDAEVFNLSGELVYTYHKDYSLTKGRQFFRWCGNNDQGTIQSPGLYIVFLKARIKDKADIKKLGVYLLN